MNKVFKKVMAIVAVVALTFSLAACGSSPETKTKLPETFPAFTATDLTGKSVSSDMFKDNAVTVLNLWFTGCEACVQEMPQLEKISKELEAKGGKMVGICTDATDDKMKKEATDILKKSGATYTNLSVDNDSEAGKFLGTVMAYPTTLLVDRQGHIVGDAIVGSIDSQEQIDNLMKRVDEIVAKDGGAK